MKTLRKIGMAFLAIVLCVGFTACSDDDDEGSAGSVKKKRLVEMSFQDSEYANTTRFSYDEKGHLSRVEHIEKSSQNEYRNQWKYYWEGDKILSDGDYSDFTHTLKNGLVISSKAKYSDYANLTMISYDSQNRLVSVQDQEGKFIYEWDNNRIVKECWESGDLIQATTFEYDGKTCGGYNPWLLDWDGLDYLTMTNPELFGYRTNQLPSRCVWKTEERETIEEYSYKFDNDKYITNLAIKTIDKSPYYGTTIETNNIAFKWE